MCEMKGPRTQQRHSDRTFKNTEWGEITDSPCEAKMKIKKKKNKEIVPFYLLFSLYFVYAQFYPSDSIHLLEFQK